MRFKRSPWSEDETIRLSAYLDHYAKKRRENGKWSVEATLFKLATHINSRSSKQIERKLLKLWGGPDATSSNPKFQDVFKNGSRCLGQLPDVFRPLIQDTLKAIEISEACQMLNTPQTLRSGKGRSVSIETQRQTPRHGFLGEGTPTKLSSKKSRRTTLQRELPTIDGQTCDVSGDLSTLSGGVFANAVYGFKIVKDEASSTIGMKSPVPGASAHADVNTTPGNAHVEVADSFESMPDAELEGFEMTKRRLFYLDDVQRVPAIDYDRLSETEWAPQMTNARGMHEMIRDLLYDNKHYRQKCLRLEQERTDVQREKRRKESLELISAKDPKWSMVYVVQEQDKRIADLERSLTNQEFLKPFLQSSAYHRSPLDLEKINRAYGRIASAICCLAGMEGFQCSSISHSGYESEAVHTLLERSLGPGSLSPSYKAETSQSGSIRLSCLTMQSLVGAAVCEWVFLPQLRCAAMLSTPLLESYRYHLKSLCNEQRLRNFDLAAHRFVAQDEDFRQIYLTQTAARLAEKLFAALSKVSTNDNISGQEGDIIKQLENVFFHALTIKYEVMLTKDKFDIIWPASDSVFEGFLMDKYPPEMAGAAQTHTKSNITRVELVIVPGLQCYTHDRGLDDDRAFFKADEVRVGEPVRVSKAIVSIK